MHSSQLHSLLSSPPGMSSASSPSPARSKSSSWPCSSAATMAQALLGKPRASLPVLLPWPVSPGGAIPVLSLPNLIHASSSAPDSTLTRKPSSSSAELGRPVACPLHSCTCTGGRSPAMVDARPSHVQGQQSQQRPHDVQHAGSLALRPIHSQRSQASVSANVAQESPAPSGGGGPAAPFSRLAAAARAAVIRKNKEIMQETEPRNNRSKADGSVDFLPVARSSKQIVRGVLTPRRRRTSARSISSESIPCPKQSFLPSIPEVLSRPSLVQPSCADEVAQETPMASPDRMYQTIERTRRRNKRCREGEAVSDVDHRIEPSPPPLKKRPRTTSQLQVSDEFDPAWVPSFSSDITPTSTPRSPRSPISTSGSGSYHSLELLDGFSRPNIAGGGQYRRHSEFAVAVPSSGANLSLPPARLLLAQCERNPAISPLPGPPLTSLLYSKVFRN